MRIVGGEWKSRRLLSPARLGLRPTSDRLRETLFDVLGPGVAAGGFIDAYAGTGAVGLEAFSRGARPVVWIEAEPPAAALLRANLNQLGAGADPRTVILECRLPQAVALLARLGALRATGGAQTLFLDPPYADTAALERLLRALARHPQVLAPGAEVIAEASARTALPPALGPWRLRRSLRQGDSQLAFFSAKY